VLESSKRLARVEYSEVDSLSQLSIIASSLVTKMLEELLELPFSLRTGHSKV